MLNKLYGMGTDVITGIDGGNKALPRNINNLRGYIDIDFILIIVKELLGQVNDLL